MTVYSIDITGTVPLLGYDPNEIQRRIQLLAEMARGEWVRLAQTTLGGSAPDYIAGIQPVTWERHAAVISLVGRLPNDLEQGKNPFDMKPGLLAGPRARSTKSGGRMNIVPFRHGTPGSLKRSVGSPMPAEGLSSAGRPKSIVYTTAKKLAVSSAGPGGKTAWGGKTGDFGGYGLRTQLPQPGGRPAAYTWKNSPYAGMYKVAKFYAKAAQNQYVTFRAVSDKSDPASWWHPGFKARLLSAQVIRYVNSQIDRIF